MSTDKKVISALVVVTIVAGAILLIVENPKALERRTQLIELVTTGFLLLTTLLALWQTRVSADHQVAASRESTKEQTDAALTSAREQINAAKEATTEQVAAIRETARLQIEAEGTIAREQLEHAKEAATQQIAAAQRQADIAEGQAKSVTERAERLERATFQTELLVELVYQPDREGYPVLRPAIGNEVALSPAASELRRKFDDDSMQQVDLTLENLGPGTMREFQQKWIPFGMRALVGHPHFDYIAPQPFPYVSALRPGQQSPCRLWVTSAMYMAYGQTREEQRDAPDGAWRDMGVLVYSWTNKLG